MAGELATEDGVANPSPATGEAGEVAATATEDFGKLAEILGIGTQVAGLTANITAIEEGQTAQGLSDQADVLTAYASGLPNCDQEYTGTITADANVNAGQGISADNGAIFLGDPNGTTYSSGITLGGGALSGAGACGLQAVTGDVSAIAVGNNAHATDAGSVAPGLNASSTGADGVAIGTSASATANSVALGGSASASNGGLALGNNAVATGTSFSVAVGPDFDLDRR